MTSYPPLVLSSGGAQRPRPVTRHHLTHFLHQIQSGHVRTREHEPVLLHFNYKKGALAQFYWPADPATGRRLAPSEFEDHRRTHHFQLPCCLCALTEQCYTEARIGIAEAITQDLNRNQSVLNGEYVAVCAKQRCGYFLCLERFFPLHDLKSRTYPERSVPLPLRQLAHTVDVEESFRVGDGLFQVMTNAVIRGNRPRALQIFNPQKKVRAAVVHDLAKGMSEERFWATFVQCLLCKNVVFRETIAANHVCNIEEPNRSRYRPYALPAATSHHTTRTRVAAARLQRTYAFVMSSSPVPTEPATEVGEGTDVGGDTEVEEGTDVGGDTEVEEDIEIEEGVRGNVQGVGDIEDGEIHGETEETGGDDIPGLDSDLEMPSIPQIIMTQDLERAAATN